MTHELAAEFQLWVDQMSPYRHTMVAAYTNGCKSYIATDTDPALGGYEAASFASAGAALRYPYRLAVKAGAEGQIRHTDM